MGEDRLIIGLDFGTTFTGVAACYSNTPEDIEVIKTWPGGNGITSEKVPTEFSYENGFRWGFQIKPGEKRIRCIKLYLDRNQPIPAFASKDEIPKQLQILNRTAVDAASDYLAQIYKHAMETITKRYGDTLVGNTKKEFIVTVPAVWSHLAKSATLSAAKQAGMGTNVKMISEPEAAACYTLKAIQPNHLKIGNNMVVCDAGGGTVDLITYKITKLEPLTLEESSVGTGDLCGAAFLNYRFEDHVKSRLGNSKFNQMVNKQPKTWQTGLKYFEDYVKRNFNEQDEEEFNVPFPGVADDYKAGVDSGFMVLTSEQVRGIFNPVIEQVINLIQGQVSAVQSSGGTVSAILLVGGFGQSIYLYERVKAYFKTANAPGCSSSTLHKSFENMTIKRRQGQKHQADAITVMQPPNARPTLGLQLYHYGTVCYVRFDPDIHPEHSKRWDDLDEMYRVDHTMQWYVEKNGKVAETRDIAMVFSQNYRRTAIPRGGILNNVVQTLYASTANEAPVFYDPSSMFVVCTIISDLREVPRRFFTRRLTSDGEAFWTLDYTLEMRIDSAQLEFALKVGDVQYGSVTADFDSKIAGYLD